MPMNNAKHKFPNPWTQREKEHSYFSDKNKSNSPLRDDEGEHLSRQAVLLLLVNGLFGAANALSGIFVNVYLWKVSNDFALIGWFALATQLANASTFFLAGKWVKEGNKMNALRVGVALSAVFYMVVLFLQESAVNYVFYLGLLQGLAFGLFWLSFNVVYFEVTGPDNRDKFNGWAGLLGSFAGMVAPWLSGIMISQMGGATGYRFIFAVSLGVFVVGAVVSFFLKKRQVDGNYEWKHCLKHIRVKGNPWRNAVPALMSQGVREGVFAFIIGLMVFIATNDEMRLGNYALVTSAVALISFWLTGKFLRPAYRNRAMFFSTAALIVVILPFFWEVNYTTLLVFGIGTALFMPLYTIPMTSTVFDIIGRDHDSALHRVEYVVLRELALNVGRILGILAFILVIGWRHDEVVLNWLLLCIGSFPIVTWLCMRILFKEGLRGDVVEAKQ